MDPIETTNELAPESAQDQPLARPHAKPITRGSFFKRTGAAAIASAMLGTGIGLAPLAGITPSAAAAEIGPLLGSARADQARDIRTAAATFQRSIPLTDHPDNGDEARYSDRAASYHKALQHDTEGRVMLSEYTKLKQALTSGNPADFEALTVLMGNRKLVDPLAAYAYQLEGSDSHSFKIPAAPAFKSDQTQGEMAELYWMALARDIPFDNYAFDGSGIIQAAVDDLNRFRDIRAPKQNNLVTRTSLFRDVLPNNLVGNFVSQFLLKTVPYGPQFITQTNRTRLNGDDRMTNYDEWLLIQNGYLPSTAASYDGTLRYIRNGRDMAEWTHLDPPLQACLNAARLIVAQGNTIGDPKFSPGINSRANPYNNSGTQVGFITFGNQHFMDLLTRVMQYALQAAWYQKWLVHRRLRPEEFGGRVESTLRRTVTYQIGDQLKASLQDSSRLGRIFSRYGNYLLPQAFPEGSPTHPAYPSGHSTYMAAGVTMIKAFVNGNQPVLNPMRISDPVNGETLSPYTASALMINDELDKLVMNVGIGRVFAGVHWRSDHAQGVRLGELVAMRVLQDLARTYRENFAGFELRRFNGSTVIITSTAVTQNGTALPLSNALL